MARSSRTKYAVLGLLARGPASGYDVKKVVENDLGHFWGESYGQIYPVLALLEREGLADKVVEHTDGKPDRHVYRITLSGIEALRSWLTTPPEPTGERIEALLKLNFAGALPRHEALRLVAGFRDQQRTLENEYREQAQELEALEQESPSAERTYRLLTLRCAQRVRHAYVEWCNEALTTLAQMPED